MTGNLGGGSILSHKLDKNPLIPLNLEQAVGRLPRPGFAIRRRCYVVVVVVVLLLLVVVVAAAVVVVVAVAAAGVVVVVVFVFVVLMTVAGTCTH